MKDLAKKIENGERRALAKAITLIESTKAEDQSQGQDLLTKLLPKSGKSLRLGISGIPGVGKSSFIEVLGLELIKKGHKVAVLAIDPSSPVSGGSILGDKTRMEELSQSHSAFIRPSPTTGNIGGVAAKTRETIFLCEAAGYDIIIIETVGVGQSEYEVKSMVDLFMVLMVPNAGDELQGIKKGIIELADLLIINKADGETKVLAENAKTTYQNALNIIRKEKFWQPMVLTSSSLLKEGFDEILKVLKQFESDATKSHYLTENRQDQTKHWLFKQFQNELLNKVKNDQIINNLYQEIENKVISGSLSVREGSQKMIEALFKA